MGDRDRSDRARVPASTVAPGVARTAASILTPGVVPTAASTLGALAVAVALAAGAAGCGDAAEPAPAGSVTFDYGGAVSGSFSAAGPPPPVSVEGVPEFGNWALGAAGDSLGGVVIAGFRTTDEETGDLFVLQLDEVRTGEFTCEPNAECHGRVLFGIPDHGGLPASEAELWFEIVSGTVQVNRAAGGTLAGTFSFTARDQGGSGDQILTVVAGSFEVPLAGQGTGASVVCLGQNAAGRDCG